HQAMVCGIALGILGDIAASEDAGQEAFIAAWRRLGELKDPERLRSWLGQIARNAALMELRRRRDSVSLSEESERADATPPPDQRAASDDERALVQLHLNRLPETYRLPLVLYYREEQSVRAVAEALGLSEDAVKQRLARGRDLLRDQLSGVIETVLIRTAPSAVFTVAVASAIGALASPAAVAAGAFAGTAAAGSGAGSGVSILGLMNLSKATFVTALLVTAVCIPIGRHLGLPPPREDSAHLPSAAGAATPEPFSPDSAILAEWKRLHDEHGSGPEAMPRLYQAIAELEDPLRQKGFHTALLFEWLRVDPDGGLAFFRDVHRDPGHRKLFVEGWLNSDPDAAISALLAHRDSLESLTRDSLPLIGQKAPGRLAEVVAQWSKPKGYWDHQVHDAFAAAAEADLAAARAGAEGLPGPNRDLALSGIAQAWARTDLDAALAWARSLPDVGDRDELMRAALVGQAVTDPVAALARAGEVPGGGREDSFASTTGARVIQRAAETDFEATVAWLMANPGQFRSEDLIGLTHEVTQKMNGDAVGFLNQAMAEGSLNLLVPAMQLAIFNRSSGQRPIIWEWLNSQLETEPLKALREVVLTTAAFQDPELALRWVSDLPATPAADQQLHQVSRDLWHLGSMIDRFDDLMQQAPERLREPLLQASFAFLDQKTLGDPQDWVQRLEQLPEVNREEAIGTLSRAWVSEQPEDAAAWALTLPSGTDRTEAIGTIGVEWAKSDAVAAAAWVSTLPEGDDRDMGAEAIVIGMADRYPEQAWAWANSIQDIARRLSSATFAIRTMSGRDPSQARQWIAEGPFPPKAQEYLYSTFLPSGTTPTPP
ncbi:MAG: sigma-70 family RNA polymerase sigma factor, partial [Verrucomicrobiae bacterium]|nr:sigma-70 family RNA polymerase sigma factor [Verrucomicrobiae bacterium]